MLPLSWEEAFFAGSLPEERLRLRAIVIGKAMTERPGLAMTGAFDAWGETRNAYNFFGNPRMSLPVLLDPPTRALGLRLRELPEGTTVLCVQDTTEINLSQLTTMTGLGTLGNPKNRGEFLHSALAVDTQGVPLGLLGAQTWTRPVEALGEAKTRHERAFEDKESVRWWSTIEAAEERVGRPGLLVHVADREGDIYEVFARSEPKNYRLLIRARHDRTVEGEEGEHASLWSQTESFAPSEERRVVDVPPRPATKGKPARPARQATVEIRFGPVTIHAPSRALGAAETVTLWAVRVREVDPPANEDEPLDWLLLTSDPLGSFADAWLRVTWYRFRWVIEEFHKVLKTGCRIEARQFESLPPFEVSLGLSMLTAVHLLALTKRARIDPEQPARSALSEAEEQVLLEHAAARGRSVSSPLRLADAVLLIAILGGYLNRACDGPPGWITLWRGYQRLVAMVEGYQLARSRAGPPSAAF